MTSFLSTTAILQHYSALRVSHLSSSRQGTPLIPILGIILQTITIETNRGRTHIHGTALRGIGINSAPLNLPLHLPVFPTEDKWFLWIPEKNDKRKGASAWSEGMRRQNNCGSVYRSCFILPFSEIFIRSMIIIPTESLVFIMHGLSMSLLLVYFFYATIHSTDQSLINVFALYLDITKILIEWCVWLITLPSFARWYRFVPEVKSDW